MSVESAVAFAAIIVSSICNGFMFAPLRNYECGDGFFVQLIQCIVVLLFGTEIHIVRGLPPFNLIASLGGVFFGISNPICSAGRQRHWNWFGYVDLGVYTATGWCIAHFGLFGTNKQTVANEPMNYAGLALTIVSGVMFIFVRTDEADSDTPLPENSSEETLPEYGDRKESDHVAKGFTITVPLPQVKRRFQLPAISMRKISGVLMSMIIGVLVAIMTTPIIYVQNNDKNASQNVLDYVFSHFVGIFVTTTLIFFCYTFYKRGEPFVDGKLVIPAGLFGVLWSLGMVLFFVSNDHITQTITYPITGRLPAIIGALVDVFIFKSIKGTKNLIFLTISVSIGVLGVILVSLSNG